MNSLQEMRNFSICLKVVWFCLFSHCFKNVVENQQCQEAISLSPGQSYSGQRTTLLWEEFMEVFLR